jgi:hypothetical protein
MEAWVQTPEPALDRAFAYVRHGNICATPASSAS